MVKDIYFTLRTGFTIRIAVEENTIAADIKKMLYHTKLSHFKPETMKFICNGIVINDHECLPSNTTLVALAIIKSNNDVKHEKSSKNNLTCL